MITIAEQQHLEAGLNELIERCRNLSIDDLSSRAVITARHSLMDWLGCTISGSNETAAQRFLGVIDPAAGDMPVIGTPNLVHWRDAVVINGFNGHLLDFDDMLPSFSGHSSAVVVPALLTVGEQIDATLDQVLAALVVGTEVGNWVASQVMPGHYDAGWHATGTIGTFAAAAAICHLHGLSHSEWVGALDVAATQAAGLKAVFGTLAKPMHAGNSSQAGIIAANLATLTSSSGKALIGAFGFIANYRGTGSTPVVPLENFAIEGMLYKTFASCFMTQAAVDAGQQAAGLFGREAVSETDNGFDSVLVNATITLRVSPKLREVCAIEDPLTANDAKFSLHATFALSALGFDLSREDAFDPDNLQLPEYRKLREKITLDFDPTLAGNEPKIGVLLSWQDGRQWETTIDRGVPAADVDAREHALTAKFRQLAEPYVGEKSSSQIINLIINSSTTPISEITAITTRVLISEITV